MRKQFFPLLAATMLAVLSHTQVATCLEPGRYTALTLRQYLHDEACVALADGQIDASERARLLRHGKSVLKAEEYETFRASLDRTSPPKPVVAKRGRSSVDKSAVASKSEMPTIATAKKASSRSARPLPPVFSSEGSLGWLGMDSKPVKRQTAARSPRQKSPASDVVIVSDHVVSRSVVR